MSPLARPVLLAGSAVVFLAGAGAGFALRPVVGEWWGGERRGRGAPLYPALWRAQVEQFVALDAASPGPSVVYLGDSLTDWIRVEEVLRFEGGVVLNRGISGDTVPGLNDRVRRSFPRNARACFVLVGYNDLAAGAEPLELAEHVAALGRYLRDTRGVKHVVVESLPATRGVADAVVQAYRDALARSLAREPGLVFLDLHAEFGTPRSASDLVDGIHFSQAGALRRLAAELDLLGRIAPDVAQNLSLTKTP